MDKHKRIIYVITGISFLLFSLILSVIFFKERCFSFDSAFVLWKMIVTNDFSIEHFRNGDVVCQSIPLMFIKLKVSLLHIAISYSMSIVLMQIIIYLFITLILKDVESGIIYILTLLILIRNAFYFPCTEVQQGMPFLILQLSVMRKCIEKDVLYKNRYLLFSGLLSIILLNFHVLLILPAFFVHGYLFIDDKFNHKREIAISTLFLSAATFYKRILCPVSEYEINKQIPIKKRIEILPDTFNFPSTKYFFYFISEYWMFVVPVIILLIFFQLKRGSVLLFAYYWTVFLGICLLIFQTHYLGESPMMYENYYIVISFLIALGLVLTWKVVFHKNVAIAVFIIFVVCSSFSIVCARKYYSLRIDYLERIVKYGQTMPEKKYILAEENYPQSYAWSSWALPFETTLISALSGPMNTVSIFSTIHVKQSIMDASLPNAFLCPTWTFSRFKIPSINNYIFTLPSNHYRVINENCSTLTAIETKNNQSTIIATLRKGCHYGDAIIIDVSIKNFGKDTIFSGNSGNRGYKIFVNLSGNGGLMHNQFSFLLEHDFKYNLQQKIIIDLSKADFENYNGSGFAKIYLKLNDNTISESNLIQL